MRLAAITIILGGIPLSAFGQQIGDLPLLDPAGTSVPSEIRNWMKIINVEDGSSKAPVIWISPTKFERRGNERLINLSRISYEGFSQFVRRYPCGPVSPVRPKDTVLEIYRHAGSIDVIVCRMPRTKACKFLSKLKAGPFLKSEPQGVKDLAFLAAVTSCRE